MKRSICYSITEKHSGQPISAWLRSVGYSHRILTELKNSPAGILLNGAPARLKTILQEGDSLCVRLPEEVPNEKLVPSPVPLDILYEDEDLIVINKAAGVPVHPSQGNFDNTVANGLARLFAENNEPFVFRAVNRLDRDTTGLLLIAKNKLSGSILSSGAAEKMITREYLAIAEGRTDDSGTIRLPIARKTDSVIERCIDSNRGEAACTHYRLLAYRADIDCSLIRLVLETGRTHQIRVHMKAIGHPLPGDFLYHPDYRFIRRQALHSWHMTFAHPITGRILSFTAPVPEDFYFFTAGSDITAGNAANPEN